MFTFLWQGSRRGFSETFFATRCMQIAFVLIVRVQSQTSTCQDKLCRPRVWLSVAETPSTDWRSLNRTFIDHSAVIGQIEQSIKQRQYSYSATTITVIIASPSLCMAWNFWTLCFAKVSTYETKTQWYDGLNVKTKMTLFDVHCIVLTGEQSSAISRVWDVAKPTTLPLSHLGLDVKFGSSKRSRYVPKISGAEASPSCAGRRSRLRIFLSLNRLSRQIWRLARQTVWT